MLLRFSVIYSMLLTFLFLSPIGVAQKYVMDSTILAFDTNLIECSFTIVGIQDNRSTDPRYLGITEKTRYLFIPVDHIYCTADPLHVEISNMIKPILETNRVQKYDIVIHRFMLRERKSLLFPAHMLYASFDIYHPPDTSYSGSLTYELSKRKGAFQNKPLKSYESLISNWQNQFIEDLNTLTKTRNTPMSLPANYTAQPSTIRKTMNAGIDLGMGLGWFTLDGEIFFAYPESSNKFIRTPYHLRYRNSEDFESLEFGIGNDHIYYRLNRNLLFCLKSKLFFGINRWKDIEEGSRGLEEVPILDYSLNQVLLFNKKNKKGFVAGIGLTENIYYIYGQKPVFKPGGILYLGVHL